MIQLTSTGHEKTKELKERTQEVVHYKMKHRVVNAARHSTEELYTISLLIEGAMIVWWQKVRKEIVLIACNNTCSHHRQQCITD